jgi:hypothetical protein
MLSKSLRCQILFVIGWLLTFHSSFGNAAADETLERELAEFEAEFRDSLDYKHHGKGVKLIGYKKILVPVEELENFNEHYLQTHAEWKKLKNAHYDPYSGTLRVYFPVEGGLVEHGGRIIEATELGELDVESEVDGDCSVLGRKQTDNVTGVVGNIIKDGIIYLAEKNRPHHRFDNVYVYDFGEKVILDHHDHSHHSARDSGHGEKSCMNNHGGPNCSNKFNIHNGRCPRRSDVCVDYNGYWTNCQKGGSRWKNFPGSDCFTALALGHCWNEVM